MSLFEKGSELVRKGKDLIKSGKDQIIRKTEKTLKIERIKMDIQNLKREKEERLKDLARKVYELYVQNKLTNEDLISICQDIKTLQWQIDEKWIEINNIKSRKNV